MKKENMIINCINVSCKKNDIISVLDMYMNSRRINKNQQKNG